MDIALIMQELLVEGGGERQCVSLARALKQQGHEVTLYTSAYDREHCFPEICKDLTIRDVGRGALPRLRKPVFLRAYLDARRMAAVVGTRHEIWNPHHWPGQWAAVWLKRKLGGKVVWMCNDVPNFLDKARAHRLRAPWHRWQYSYDRKQNREADLTLFLSRWAESEFRAIYDGPTRVVRSGADPECFAPGGDREKIRARFDFQPDEFVLLWMGIFMPHRRLQDAIQAVQLAQARNSKVRLLLAGSDRSYPGYLAELKGLVERLGVQKQVLFTGKVAEEEIRDFYCACDTFLFPNENQTWGLAVLEAMACGRPVLVSRGAAVQEVLTDEENALLFPARDPAALAQRIERLAGDPRLRQEIAQRGMTLIRTTYNWSRFAEQIAEICREVAGQDAARSAAPAPAAAPALEERQVMNRK